MLNKIGQVLRLFKLHTNKNGEEVFVGEDYKITAEVNLGDCHPKMLKYKFITAQWTKLNDPQTFSTVVMKPDSEKVIRIIYISGILIVLKAVIRVTQFEFYQNIHCLLILLSWVLVYWADDCKI